MSENALIPAGLKAPSTVFAKTENERLSEGIESTGYPIIGTSGKQFYMRFRGVRKIITKATPDQATGEYEPATHLDFVLLRKNKLKSHVWYERGYQDGSDDPPDCSSTDGIGPDDQSKKPQSHLCDICPRHEWKFQAKTGKDGRECQDNMRTAILPLNLKHMFGQDIAEPVFFRIPAASLTALGQIGDMMIAAYGEQTRYSSYIIRATFKKDVKWQQFEYRVIDMLNDQWAEFVLKLRNDPMTWRILGFNPSGSSLYRLKPVEQLQRELLQLTHQPAQPGPQPTPPEPKMIDVTPDRPPMDNGAVGDRLAAERAERIAAARGGQAPPPRQQTLDLQANASLPETNVQPPPQQAAPPQQGPAPWDGHAPPDTPQEISDVISRMGPPGA